MHSEPHGDERTVALSHPPTEHTGAAARTRHGGQSPASNTPGLRERHRACVHDPPQADEARLLPYLDDLRGEAVYAARMVLANRQGLYALVPHADA